MFHIITSQTPPWLEGMIAHRTWRSMIYKLAEQYPDCLMLNFTIKVENVLPKIELEIVMWLTSMLL